jgi:hypothetical protein
MTTTGTDDRAVDPRRTATLRAEALRLTRSVPALRRGRLRVFAAGLVWLGVGIVLFVALLIALFTDPGVPTLVMAGLWAGALIAALLLIFWWGMGERAHNRRIVALLAAGADPDSVVSSLPDPVRPSAVRPLVVSVLVFAVVGGVLSGWFVARDAAATAAREAPTGPELVVADYLDALAAGDGDKAADMDDTGKRGSLGGANRETFLDGEALATATEFITDVSATEVGARSTSNSTPASVTVAYTLAGERYSRTVDVGRDGPDAEWQLRDSLAVPVQVAATGGAQTEFVNFSLGGIRTPEPSYLGYAAYPGVYELEVDIDPARLADPSATPVERDFAVAHNGGGLEVVYLELAED